MVRDRKGISIIPVWSLRRYRLRQQIQRTIEARANADRGEVPPVSRQNAVHLASFGDGCHRSVDQSQFEFAESGIQLKRACDVGGKGRLVFVTGCRVEDFRDQSAHHSAFGPQEVIHVREHEAGNNYGRRGDQDFLVVRETGSASRCPCQCSQETAGVGDNRRNQPSRSRKSSDSSPSFALVDSNRRVEGGAQARIVARGNDAQTFTEKVRSGKSVRAGAFQRLNILFFKTNRGRDQVCNTFNIPHTRKKSAAAHYFIPDPRYRSPPVETRLKSRVPCLQRMSGYFGETTLIFDSPDDPGRFLVRDRGRRVFHDQLEGLQLAALQQIRRPRRMHDFHRRGIRQIE